MVSPIRNADHIRALASLIQRSVARPAGNRSDRRAVSGKQANRQREGVLNSIVERARAIDPTNPNRERLAMHLFIEGVLLAELGERMAIEPAFQHLVSEIEDTLYTTPALQDDLQRAALALTGRAP